MIRFGIFGKSEKQLDWAVNIVDRMNIFKYKVKLINEYMIENNIEDEAVSEFLNVVNEDLKKIVKMNVAGDLIHYYGYCGVSKDKSKSGFRLYLEEFFEDKIELINRVCELDEIVVKKYNKKKEAKN